MKTNTYKIVIYIYTTIFSLFWVANLLLSNGIVFDFFQNLLFSSAIFCQFFLIIPFCEKHSLFITKKKKGILKIFCLITIIPLLFFFLFYLNIISYDNNGYLVDILTGMNILMIVYISISEYKLIKKLNKNE